uniref:Gastrin/cholecystokinin-like peptide D1 n=1 Tax=Nephrops norvegicus TaxID=6829 RepID=D1_NEPNO|nr:RecName: Full=Gastrin/cholecystokinin-like peptide D1 [Nephrops norvegicus]AAB20623.1 gastrin/cholecystokinin-like peptide D1 (G/CCK D1) [Nephrops norvegicus, Peptide Partial, 9 aa] [Nephrops norvegicus]
SEGGQDFWL